MAHLNYYLDLCVETFVVNDDAVLLRFHDKYKFWASPGGHIDPGEDVNEAALREVWEEVGLKVSLVGPEGWVKQDTKTNQDLVPPIFVNRHKIKDIHEHSAFVFAAKSDSREINPQSEEDKKSATECRWCTKADLDELLKNDPAMREEVYKYASTALKLVR